MVSRLGLARWAGANLALLAGVAGARWGLHEAFGAVHAATPATLYLTAATALTGLLAAAAAAASVVLALVLAADLEQAGSSRPKRPGASAPHELHTSSPEPARLRNDSAVERRTST